MALATAVELAWWTVCRVRGWAPLPFVGSYTLIVAAALAFALLLRRFLAPARPQAAIGTVAIGSILFAVGASVFLPLKFSIPKIMPFWLDVPLADLDRAMFGGEDPWRLLYSVVGWATPISDRIYGLWLPVQTVTVLALMLEPPSIAKSRALVAYALGWLILGVGAALLMSSAGPLFFDRLYHGTRFAGLDDMLRSRGAWMTLSESDAMWASFASDRPNFVAGISAAPSLHVAISFWIYLTARKLAPRLAPWALAYAMFMWVASVALGWHYVADGLIGIVGIGVIWTAVGAIMALPRTTMVSASG